MLDTKEKFLKVAKELTVESIMRRLTDNNSTEHVKRVLNGANFICTDDVKVVWFAEEENKRFAVCTVDGLKIILSTGVVYDAELDQYHVDVYKTVSYDVYVRDVEELKN